MNYTQGTQEKHRIECNDLELKMLSDAVNLYWLMVGEGERTKVDIHARVKEWDITVDQLMETAEELIITIPNFVEDVEDE